MKTTRKTAKTTTARDLTIDDKAHIIVSLAASLASISGLGDPQAAKLAARFRAIMGKLA